MVGMGLAMLGGVLARTAAALRAAGSRRRAGFCGRRSCRFPSGFVAVIAGWFTAEVGRQPWVVYGLLRTADAVTPVAYTGAPCCSR